jgi:NAD(P)H-hydrate epimerase
MSGAAVLVASTALRAGAGLVVLALPDGVDTAVASHPDLTEVMTTTHPSVLEMLPRFSAIAVGPGLRVGDAQAALVTSVLRDAAAPVVVDADGLNNIAPDLVANRAAPTVITPHAGEWKRFFGAPPDEPLRVVPQAADDIGAVCLLKGSTTVIASPGGPRVLNLTGRAELATAGSGDVLTGLIAALVAQHLEPWKAAALGAYVHGLAGAGARRARDVRDAL